MDINEYQEKSWEFALPSAKNFIYVDYGLIGEIGELFSLHAKAIRDGIESEIVHTEKVRKELGDVLWFVAAVATMYGFKLGDIADLNVRKLRARHEFGTIKGSGDDR